MEARMSTIRSIAVRTGRLLQTLGGALALSGAAACDVDSAPDPSTDPPVPVDPSGPADPAGPIAAASPCTSFVWQGLPHGAKVTKAEVRTGSGVFPQACVVRGTIVSSAVSTITWAVELPGAASWNGKTLTIGGGGFDGFIPTDDEFYQTLAGPSSVPYVRISSNSGHTAQDLGWALDDTALANHAFDANHRVLEVGTEIARQFYGKSPTRRYMIGHSNGGRSALAATQRFPHDYDGAIALAPAITQQAHQINLASPLKFIFSDRDHWLSAAKVALYAAAELKECDGLDGLEDGIINNVEACEFDPAELLCEGQESDRCLTWGQVLAIKAVYRDHHAPFVFANGTTGYPRFGRGGATTSDWTAYIFGDQFESSNSFNLMAGVRAVQYAEGQPSPPPGSPLPLDLFMAHDPFQPEHLARWLRMSAFMDTTNPDLTAFADHGGKLLIWYGLADACVSVYQTAKYVEKVTATMGADRTRSFVRMVTTGGLGHNLDGPGAMSVDLLAALESWVEHSVAPDHLVASKRSATDPSTVVLQRPLCEYPKYASYAGSGDPKDAASFQCVDPGR